MSSADYLQSSLAITAIELFPRQVREALIGESEFRERYALAAEAVISFGNSGVQFQRSAFLGAIRRSFFRTAEEITAEDTSGQAWTVDLVETEQPPRVSFKQGVKQFFAANSLLLSPDKEVRLKSFRESADRVNLPQRDRAKWMSLLGSREPDDDQFVTIQADLNNTPTVAQDRIGQELGSPTISIDVLVPNSAQYYERLAGYCEDEQSFEDFVQNSAANHIEQLARWRPNEGYQLGLLLAAQPQLSAVVGSHAPETAELVKIYESLIEHGDALSRAASIEFGLSRLPWSEGIQASLSGLIQVVARGEAQSGVDPYQLLSSLFVMTYGEIARTRVLASKPAYWRRLAAIAQSVLIARRIIAAARDFSQLVDWAMKVRSQPFLAQCFVDLRLEPRWVPELVFPDQLKNELIGRVVISASTNAKRVDEVGWNDRLLSDANGSLRKQVNIALAHLPGPLEGSLAPLRDIPREELVELQSGLRDSGGSAVSFASLANAALLFRIPTEIIDLAADEIARANFQLKDDEASGPLLPYLHGLSCVASGHRSLKLADALFVLLRKYRRLYPEKLEPEEAFRIGMIASASRIDLSEWCKCVGEFVAFLAFEPLTNEEASMLHSYVTLLCHIVPELWSTCGQAEAALRSVLRI